MPTRSPQTFSVLDLTGVKLRPVTARRHVRATGGAEGAYAVRCPLGRAVCACHIAERCMPVGRAERCMRIGRAMHVCPPADRGMPQGRAVLPPSRALLPQGGAVLPQGRAVLP